MSDAASERSTALRDQVGAGWTQILCDLDTALAELDPDYSVVQVKEKFGLLRFYFATKRKYNWKMYDLVMQAERRSAVTCETCGNPGGLHSRNGWLKTICTTCAADSGQEYISWDLDDEYWL